MMNTNTIKIEKIINGGFGLGRLENGRIVLLQGALPGETVSFSVTGKKKTFLQGTVTQVLAPHLQRREPPCPYYGKCGGCDLQHCNYDEQLRIKDHIIRDLIHRHAFSKDSNSFQLHSPLPSPNKMAYRQRIRLQIDASGRPGFLRFRSVDIIPIRKCLVARPEINSVLQEVQDHPLFSRLAPHCPEMELLFNPATSRVTCLFHYRRKPRPADNNAAKQLIAEIGYLERVFFKGKDFPISEPLGGSAANTKHLTLTLDLPTYHPNPIFLSWEVGGFCQVNLDQNTQLVRLALDFCKIESSESVLDLFCGMGNFSIPLALRADSLVGIEGQGSAIRSAKRNSTQSSLTNTSFFKSPIHEFCLHLAREKKVYDCVVIDPPRQGVPGLARTLSNITSKRMIYISCDPATLCRDLDELILQGFSLKIIQPVDMFPQTHHIETVVLLEKN